MAHHPDPDKKPDLDPDEFLEFDEYRQSGKKDTICIQRGQIIGFGRGPGDVDFNRVFTLRLAFDVSNSFKEIRKIIGISGRNDHKK